MPSNTLWTIIGILLVIVLFVVVVRFVVGAGMFTAILGIFGPFLAGELEWCHGSGCP